MNDGKKNTHVAFTTTDQQLQKLFDTAEEKAEKNIKDFCGMKVLTEGGGYGNVWLETQPMGGEMYAKRNIETGINNILIFIENQNDDGRIPGMIEYVENKLECFYEWFQGYCFPQPALNIYYLIGKDKQYLKKLYKTLKMFDDYLWKYRDSDGDGCLETWCEWDTGEDNSTRLTGAPDKWGGDKPPYALGKMPYESMDCMSYSYDGRSVLAVISDILDNGKGHYWLTKAEEVKKKIRSYLWREERQACFDRDCNNEFMDVLIHNNLRAMYHGAFYQDMADQFIKYHLLNPDEFWTKMPLPSIAVNDPLFRNNETNDWSGQPEGLTYQRAIRALENYGHYAEITLLGQNLIEATAEECIFTQQFDPFTGKPSKQYFGSSLRDSYGPTILSVLEYISRLYGIHIEREQVYWGGLSNSGHNSEYIQCWNDRSYSLVHEDKVFHAYVDQQKIFTCTQGVRIVTDYDGNIVKIIGIDTRSVSVIVKTGNIQKDLDIAPNEVYEWIDKQFILGKCSKFDYPYEDSSAI